MTEERANVHGVIEDVEWESSHAASHEDSKVVSEVGSSHAERPHAADDKDLSSSKEDKSDELDCRVV